MKNMIVGLICLGTIFCGCAKDSDINGCAPDESPVKEGYLSYTSAPDGFGAVQPWMQAVSMSDSCTVDVDWMRTYACIDGEDTIITEEDFNEYTDDMEWYGLYNRSPWYAGDRLEDMPFTILDGCLHITPSAHSDRVYHWWNWRTEVPSGSTKIWFEVRFHSSGGASVQIGIDYWRTIDASYGNGQNNKEGSASEWVCADGWHVVEVGK